MNYFIRRYLQRLETFDKWKGPVRAEDLAEAGLHFVAEDIVRCSACSLKLTCWKAGDIAWEEHKKHSTHCEFIFEYYGMKYQLKTEEIVELWIKEAHVQNFLSLEIFDEKMIRKKMTERYQTRKRNYLNFEEIEDDFKLELNDHNLSQEEKDGFKLKIERSIKILEKYQCKICYDNEIEICFYPCNHMICCSKCSEEVLRSRDCCPFCSKLIRERRKIYI